MEPTKSHTLRHDDHPGRPPEVFQARKQENPRTKKWLNGMNKERKEDEKETEQVERIHMIYVGPVRTNGGGNSPSRDGVAGLLLVRGRGRRTGKRSYRVSVGEL